MSLIIHIVGNRPQFIKLAVLHKALEDAVEQEIVHTGQHQGVEMSDIFFRELGIPEPGTSLQLNSTAGPDQFIADASAALQLLFKTRKNAIAFVYGDTNTTLAAAIAARRSGVRLYHFEAGIRTGDLGMPEEINRVLTDRLADTNYCCTPDNYATMLAEGFGRAIAGRVIQSGDLMYDAFLQLPASSSRLVMEKEFLLCTIHRAGNILVPQKLAAIVDALNELHQKTAVVMPVHPHTRKRMEEYGLQPAFICLPPLGHPEMKGLLEKSAAVITDSGGMAREAFFSCKRSVVVMEKPFWPEIIKAGCSIAATGGEEIITSIEQLLALSPDFQTPIFGNGQAALIIKEDILTQA